MTMPDQSEAPSPVPATRKKRARKVRAKSVLPMIGADTAHTAQLEMENAALKRLLADLMLENALMNDRLNERRQVE